MQKSKKNMLKTTFFSKTFAKDHHYKQYIIISKAEKIFQSTIDIDVYYLLLRAYNIN